MRKFLSELELFDWALIAIAVSIGIFTIVGAGSEIYAMWLARSGS